MRWTGPAARFQAASETRASDAAVGCWRRGPAAPHPRLFQRQASLGKDVCGGGGPLPRMGVLARNESTGGQHLAIKKQGSTQRATASVRWSEWSLRSKSVRCIYGIAPAREARLSSMQKAGRILAWVAGGSGSVITSHPRPGFVAPGRGRAGGASRPALPRRASPQAARGAAPDSEARTLFRRPCWVTVSESVHWL